MICDRIFVFFFFLSYDPLFWACKIHKKVSSFSRTYCAYPRRVLSLFFFSSWMTPVTAYRESSYFKFFITGYSGSNRGHAGIIFRGITG